jgi:phage tail-like protein
VAGEETELFPVEFWRLKLGGAETDGLFMQCTLPTLTLSNSSLKHTGESAKLKTTKVAVNANWSDLTLSRGVDKKGTLYKWVAQGLPDEGGGAGKVEKKEITVELCASDDSPIQTYTFEGAWPSTYTGPSLDTNAATHAIEQITFTFDRGRMESSG